MMPSSLTPSERARCVRAELDAIVAALQAEGLVQLLTHGRRLLEDEARRASARDEYALGVRG